MRPIDNKIEHSMSQLDVLSSTFKTFTAKRYLKQLTRLTQMTMNSTTIFYYHIRKSMRYYAYNSGNFFHKFTQSQYSYRNYNA